MRESVIHNYDENKMMRVLLNLFAMSTGFPALSAKHSTSTSTPKSNIPVYTGKASQARAMATSTPIITISHNYIFIITP
jgi:hypothetical protein